MGNESALEKGIAWLSRKAAAVAGALVIVMMVTIAVDVVGRTVFNLPLSGSVEFNRTMLVAVVFFGLAATQLNKGHIRVDILLVRSSSRVRRSLEIVALLAAVVVFGVATYATIPVTMRAIAIREYEIGSIAFPVWPARLLMTLGMALYTLQLLVDLKKSIVSMWRSAEISDEERIYFH